LFVERRFHGSESSMERKFLEHSPLRSESSTGAKVPWNESSWTFRSSGANVPWNESSTGAKVLYMVFSLPGTKVQRNEKASYLFLDIAQVLGTPGVTRNVASYGKVSCGQCEKTQSIRCSASVRCGN